VPGVQDLYKHIDPTLGNLDYVYDSFDWPHCTEQGLDFRSAKWIQVRRTASFIIMKYFHHLCVILFI
jgi:hypothetical protein